MLLYYNGNCIKFNNSLTIIFQFYIIILDYDWKGENIGRKRDFSCGHKKIAEVLQIFGRTVGKWCRADFFKILIISEDSDNRDTVIMLSIYTQRLERY